MVDKIVLMTCCLHNMSHNNGMFELEVKVLHLPTLALERLESLRRNSTRAAFPIHEYFKEYFNSSEKFIKYSKKTTIVEV